MRNSSYLIRLYSLLVFLFITEKSVCQYEYPRLSTCYVQDSTSFPDSCSVIEIADFLSDQMKDDEVSILEVLVLLDFEINKNGILKNVNVKCHPKKHQDLFEKYFKTLSRTKLFVPAKLDHNPISTNVNANYLIIDNTSTFNWYFPDLIKYIDSDFDQKPRMDVCEYLNSTLEKTLCAKDEFLDYVYAYYHYPEIPKSNQIEGEIELIYYIDPNGKLTEVKVLKDNISFGAAEQLKHVLLSSPRFIPAILNNEAVGSWQFLRVHYRS